MRWPLVIINSTWFFKGWTGIPNITSLWDVLIYCYGSPTETVINVKWTMSISSLPTVAQHVSGIHAADVRVHLVLRDGEADHDRPPDGPDNLLLSVQFIFTLLPSGCFPIRIRVWISICYPRICTLWNRPLSLLLPFGKFELLIINIILINVIIRNGKCMVYRKT